MENSDQIFQDTELRIGNLDVKQGMIYCGGRDSYLEILRICCEEADSNRKLLDRLFDERDWENYIIRVHALKSTMKSLGAVLLSEQAKALELAGKNNRIDVILEGHEALMEAYCREIEEIALSPEVYPDKMAGGLPLTMRAEKEADGEPAALPALSDQTFDDKLQALEDAMYDLNQERMLQVITELEKFQYRGASLKTELKPVKRKIEMSDYMSAVDAASEIRKRLRGKD